MNFLYPSAPLQSKKPDELYATEYHLAMDSGHHCHLFSSDDIGLGILNSYPALTKREVLIYRGWMLTPTEYKKLEQLIVNAGASLLTTSEQYTHCHYLPEWYQHCKKFTPKTIFTDTDADFESLISPLKWKAYFVKDYVKSLTTNRSSIAKNAKEIKEIVNLIEKYRGQIDGGICIREFEELNAQSEERYFVFNKKVFSRNNVIPKLALKISNLIDSPFYSIDIINNNLSEPRLMELGDGQVSDIKKWTLEKFINIFNSL